METSDPKPGGGRGKKRGKKKGKEGKKESERNISVLFR
jgi:hypothetical protein